MLLLFFFRQGNALLKNLMDAVFFLVNLTTGFIDEYAQPDFDTTRR